MLKLSICLIVKNAEETIVPCLESIKDVADEIIIVDTGSTDHTLSLIKSFPKVSVFHQDWQDDFSYARNFSFSKASGDLLMWIDADDILPVQSSYQIEFLKFKNLDGLADGFTCSYQYGNDRNFQVDLSFSNLRIIKKTCYSGWKYKIHEQLDSKLVKRVSDLDATIFHNKKFVDYQKSILRNAKILKEIVRDENCDSVYYFLYGRELYFLKDHVQSKFYFEKFCAASREMSFYRYFALVKLGVFAHTGKDVKKLEKILGEIAKMKMPENFEVRYLKACLVCFKNPKAGIYAFKQLSKINDPKMELYLSKKEVLYYSKIQPFKNLITLSRALGNKEEEKRYVEQLQKLQM